MKISKVLALKPAIRMPYTSRGHGANNLTVARGLAGQGVTYAGDQATVTRIFSGHGRNARPRSMSSTRF